MIFNDIPGNKKVKKQLIDAFNNNRISHAQLFFGNSGSAKLALAFAYARYLNCTNISNSDSCGSCSSCLKYNTLSHPDLHLIFPVLKVGGSKIAISDNFIKKWKEFALKNPYNSLNNWIDSFGTDNKTGKQGVIYKDEATVIHNKLALKSFEAKYRVVLIWMPERMNLELSNKLLKLFEEPPKGTVFLLVSERPGMLLPTINSRLQRVKIKDFTSQEIEGYFNQGMSSEKAQQLKNLTNSDLGKIINLQKENNDVLDFFGEFSSWMRFIYKVDVAAISSWTEKIASAGRNYQRLFLSYAIKMIRECLILSFANKSLLRTNEKEHSFICNFAPFIHEENSVLIVEEVEQAIKEINRNANAKILFFDLSLQMVKFIKLKRKFAVK